MLQQKKKLPKNPSAKVAKSTKPSKSKGTTLKQAVPKTIAKGASCKMSKKTSVQTLVMPKKLSFAKTAGVHYNGVRLSAAYYFYELCNGDINRCEPQMIMQPNGRMELKEIRIVQGAHGWHPRWVLSK